MHVTQVPSILILKRTLVRFIVFVLGMLLHMVNVFIVFLEFSTW